jgi:large subunit ribosomal protein L25
VDRKALSDVFREGAGENAIFLLKLGGSDQSRHAMIREMQRDPVSRKPLHIDFVRVLMDVKITIKVPIEVVGVAKGVKAEGGILDVVTREVEIECLPGNIPAHLAIDVNELAIGDAIRIGQIPAPEGVRIVDNPEKVVLHVAHPTREEEAAPAAEAAAEPTEPEVLKKGKAVAEEEGGEEKPEKKEKEKEK